MTTTCMIWCEQCAGENWDEVSGWKWQGRAATRSGTLKVATTCRSCDAELPAGERAEAIALHHTEEAIEWAREYLEFDGEAESRDEKPELEEPDTEAV